MHPAATIAPLLIGNAVDDETDFVQRLKTSLFQKPDPLGKFVVDSWPILQPNRELVPNWHIDYIVEHLEAVTLGQITRLIINLPPRSLKSNLVSIDWPVWSWTFKPWLRWIFASYAASLSHQHSRDRRRIIESSWYQKRWGDMVSLQDDQNRQDSYENTQRGVMISTSVDGSITGKVCDIMVIDDLINPDHAESKLKRESAIEFYRLTLSTRLDDKRTGAIVGVEQRLNVNDWTACALKEGGWTHIKLPMEAESRIVYSFPRSGRTYERREGELLNPSRDTREAIERQKMSSGTRGYKAQFQQEPISKDGGYLKYEWWKFFNRAAHLDIPEDMRPAELLSVWAWDTAAETGQENDFTAGCRMAKVGNKYRVLRWFKKKLEYPQMKQRVKTEFETHRADILTIEKTSNGQAVIQDFQQGSDLPVVPFTSVKDKVSRVSVISPMVEAGLVELPEDDPLTNEFMDEAAAFPNAEHDDMVDAFTIALMKLSGKDGSGSVGIYMLAEGEADE
jgi:predicted phage terminase large subunit-like protein